VTGPDQGFLMSRLVLTLKPWERGWVVPEQSGKVEYERERLLGIAKKLTEFISDSQQPFALVFDFPLNLLGDNLN
jgi:hypothetical protein